MQQKNKKNVNKSTHSLYLHFLSLLHSLATHKVSESEISKISKRQRSGGYKVTVRREEEHGKQTKTPIKCVCTRERGLEGREYVRQRVERVNDKLTKKQYIGSESVPSSHRLLTFESGHSPPNMTREYKKEGEYKNKVRGNEVECFTLEISIEYKLQ